MIYYNVKINVLGLGGLKCPVQYFATTKKSIL